MFITAQESTVKKKRPVAYPGIFFWKGGFKKFI
jgi:hypothetical protein